MSRVVCKGNIVFGLTYTPPVVPVDEYLYNESGSIYTLGPYDTFEAYDSGSAPSSRGFGWNENWKIQKRYDFSVVGVDFMGDYISGSLVSGSDGNDAGWSGSYNVFDP